MAFKCPKCKLVLEDVGNYLDTQEDLRYTLFVCVKCGFEHRIYEGFFKYE